MNEKVIVIKSAIVAAGTAAMAALGWKGALLAAWVIVMGLDYLSGTIAACKNGEWSSTVAREGLNHKGGMIFTVLVAAITDWVMAVIVQYVPIGINWPGVIMPLVLAWYLVTELGSILENAVKMGATVPSWLIKLLKASANMMEAAGEKAAASQEETHINE